MEPRKKTWLSPTGLNSLDRCPRCFWLRYNRKIYQPEGISSRLPSRFDTVIKAYFDKYRAIGQLPPLVEGKMEGVLQKPFTETYFYHHDDGKYGYYGKLDECLVDESGLHTPVDHKTSSSDPRDRNEVFPAYQHQLDSYAWLLEANRKKTSGIAYLLYFYPDFGDNLQDGFPMITMIKTLKTDPARAKAKFLEGIRVLEGEMPEPSPDCPFCAWHETMEIELGKIEERKRTEKGDEEKNGEQDLKEAWGKGRLF